MGRSSITNSPFKEEFGLIVCALAATNQWISNQWLAVMGIAVSITFIIASPLNAYSNQIYVKFEVWLEKFESKRRLLLEQQVPLQNAKILIFGMGRVGTGAYETTERHYPGKVTGVDISQESVDKHRKLGRKVILADATDPDFWQRINHSEVQMVMLAMPKHIQNILALEQLKASGYTRAVTAIANYPDQQRELQELGVDSTYNFYLEAGRGFAEHVNEKII